MKILAFDTTNSSLSVALLEDEQCLEKTTITESSKQSQLLIPTIEILLNKQNIWYQDLDLICATKGPGSFTGIRVGISAIKAIQIALKTPVILLDSLFVIANKYKDEGKILIINDAKMDEFFVAEFLSKKGEIKIIQDSKLIKADELLDYKNNFNGKIIADELLEADLVGQVGYHEFLKNNSSQSSDALYIRNARITQRKK